MPFDFNKHFQLSDVRIRMIRDRLESKGFDNRLCKAQGNVSLNKILQGVLSGSYKKFQCLCPQHR